jgi:regulator of protease activity HflC (stomatin/prohibitin superfamily)
MPPPAGLADGSTLAWYFVLCALLPPRGSVSILSMLPTALIALAIAILWLAMCLNILREYERAVVFRLGRLLPHDKGPGLVLILWPIDKMVRMSLRVVTWEIPPQDIITRDNVSLKVNAVVYFRVVDATKSVVAVENYRFAVEQAAQTGLRTVLGEVELDDLLSQREKLNERLQTILDEHTEPWGIKVTQVQVKQVDLPQDMQRAIAAQAEAERERRAKIIAAQGEFQAATKLAEAAAVLSREPAAITLRYLQTLIEIGVEKNTTIIFPLPMDLIAGLAAPRLGGNPAPLMGSPPPPVQSE